MRILVIVLFILCVNAHAVFVASSIGCNFIQEDVPILDPAGIISWSAEVGFGNEPQNFVDYKFSFEIKRTGYSWEGGKESVSLYLFSIKPITWSVTYKRIMLEIFASISQPFYSSNMDEQRGERYRKGFFGNDGVLGYGSRLGYNLNEHLLLALKFDSSLIQYEDVDCFWVGGWGFSAQWNF